MSPFGESVGFDLTLRLSDYYKCLYLPSPLSFDKLRTDLQRRGMVGGMSGYAFGCPDLLGVAGKELQDGGVHEAGVFPLREMPGIRRQEERTVGNGRLQGLSYRRGKDLVVGSPHNERGVRNFR